MENHCTKLRGPHPPGCHHHSTKLREPAGGETCLKNPFEQEQFLDQTALCLMSEVFKVVRPPSLHNVGGSLILWHWQLAYTLARFGKIRVRQQLFQQT